MKKLLFISAFSAFCSTVFSQITFVKGYIVQAKGDTIRGEVKINTKKEFDNYSKVFFKDPNNVQKNHKPDKIKAYGYEGGKNYIASKFDGEPAFYKIVVQGDMMLLEMMFEMMQMNETTFKNEFYIAKKGDAEFTRIKTNKFKKQLSEFMKDQPDLASEVDDKFELEKAIDVITRYNAAQKH